MSATRCPRSLIATLGLLALATSAPAAQDIGRFERQILLAYMGASDVELADVQERMGGPASPHEFPHRPHESTGAAGCTTIACPPGRGALLGGYRMVLRGTA